MQKTRIAVIGAGAIGRLHAETIASADFCSLAAIADPADAAREFAARLGAPWGADYRRMLDEVRPDAVIVATPNDLHVSAALDVIARGLPVLVEKPIAATAEDGARLVAASAAAGVPTLVGHHRRHNPVIREARRLVRDGALGELTSIAVLSNVLKPDEYFAPEWRRKPGAGPVLINLIHEIDLIRFMCGEIASVHAMTSNARRGFEVEDTAAVILRLENGALTTMSLSDSATSPWSWDLSSGELPNYPPQPAYAPSHFICGTHGALALPSLELWRYDGKRSWFAPLSHQFIEVRRESPYVAQLRQLCRVVRSEEEPLITAADGLQTLRATLAVHESARARRPVDLLDPETGADTG